MFFFFFFHSSWQTFEVGRSSAVHSKRFLRSDNINAVKLSYTTVVAGLALTNHKINVYISTPLNDLSDTPGIQSDISPGCKPNPASFLPI